MRSAPSNSIASRTPSGPLDSPACTVRFRPAAPGTPEGLGKARPGAPGGGLVAVDRQGHDARMAQLDQQVDQFGRGVGRLRAQQAHAQAHRRQAVLLGGAKAGIERVDHVRQPPVPGLPVRRVEDQVGIARAAGGQPLAERIGRLGQLLARAHQAAGPVEEVQEVGQPFEAEQALARARHRLAELARPLLQQRGVEAAFEVHMHFGLGQGLQPLHPQLGGLHGVGPSPEAWIRRIRAARASPLPLEDHADQRPVEAQASWTLALDSKS